MTLDAQRIAELRELAVTHRYPEQIALCDYALAAMELEAKAVSAEAGKSPATPAPITMPPITPGLPPQTACVVTPAIVWVLIKSGGQIAGVDTDVAILSHSANNTDVLCEYRMTGRTRNRENVYPAALEEYERFWG